MRGVLMASEGGGESVGMSDYISHHLHHLASHHQEGMFDLHVLHLDTVF